MATNPKKGKGKDPERKSSKKVDEVSLNEDKKDENTGDESATSAVEEPTPEPEPPTPTEPTPEPVYEEPVLTQLIVESYEGDQEKGLYEGEGGAFFSGGHQYKGQFHEGLMHGRGMYTWADGVIYEGEFTSNQVTGKGLYTWTDGSTYEGEVVTGLRHGFGTFRSANSQLSFTGEWYMGKRHGKGRMDYDADGISFYEGDWVENSRHGWGTRRYPSGNIYQGMWFNNMRHGEGNMRWLDRDQMYNGQWENGVQHGLGQHIWFLKRVGGSQYPLRNMYDGEFVKGLRDGHGMFYYANGARYDGTWKDNMKHGKGKFIFKNGRVYEGVFEKDHIVEFPDFQMDGVTTPDLTQIRTRTPLPSENASVHSNESRNTYSPSFQLEVDYLLEEFAEEDRQEEAAQVLYVIMRYVTSLRKIYNFYSSIGYEESPDNTFVMNRMQFWRFLKDCKLHFHDKTLAEMDRHLAHGKSVEEIHNPYSKVLFREFTNSLVVLAYHIYQEEQEEQGPVLAYCMSKLIADNILKNACCVRGFIYQELRRAVNVLVHSDQTYEIYQSFCSPRKAGRKEPSMKMRQFLFMMKDLCLINDDLTTKAIIDILASDDPKVADSDGACNMELEMTFLEFFEALVGCAQIYVTEAVVKDPTTPRPSTTMTHEQSYMSVPGSPSRMASQIGEEGGDETTEGVSPEKEAYSEAGSPNPRSASQNTSKTTSTKQPDNQQSTSSAVNAPSEVTHPESPHKSEIPVGGAPQKSTSFISNQSGVSEGQGPDGVKSAISVGQSLGAAEEASEGDFDYDGDDLDEASRQFNFWTHQLHIFFVRKFFPSAHKMLFLKQLVKERYPTQIKEEEEKEGTVGSTKASARSRTAPSTSRGKSITDAGETCRTNTPADTGGAAGLEVPPVSS